MNVVVSSLLAFALALPALAQKPDYVKWSLTLDPAAAAPGSKVLGRLTGRIEPGWHMYSMSTPAAIPTTVTLAPKPAIASFRVLQPPPKRAFDPNFQRDSETYENEATFLTEVQLAAGAPAGPAEISAEVRYQLCNDKSCIPPVRRSATATLMVDPSAAAASFVIPAGYAEARPPSPSSTPAKADSQGLAAFLLVAFGFGLAAIFTPCVFPMIPITMSFFLNRQSSLFQAAVFCLGIIVLFSGLGLAATAILGPFGVVQLGSNPWVNGFISAVFLAFALSLLGAFEITIPSSVLTRLNAASEKGGVAGTLLMGLTFSLTSFACVGPFVGTLLAASVQGGGLRPLLGMLSFATGLALPFFLLALFPGYLKRLPRSGGWLARVKVVMGFIILAAMFKYLASLDQVLQWGLITRERFLAAWVVLFAMAGLYLLGFLRLEGVKPDEPLKLGRLFTGMAFLVFAISLIPGMFGARLGELDAYVPLSSSPGILSAGGAPEGGGLVWMKNQYREALDKARREAKRVLVSFTGYACTNCHWMKANMFTRPEIASALQDFVLVELYTDGTDAASEENQKLQLSKFSTIAIPFYAILDPDERVAAIFPSLTKDAAEYRAFLDSGKGQSPPPPTATVQAWAPFAGLSVNRLEGGVVDPATLQGKVVVLNFWATWCVPCIQEIPGFNRLHETLGNKGVAILGISMDEEGAPLIKKFVGDHPIQYPIGLGNESIANRLQVNELPVTLVFDRNGRQVTRFDGFVEEKKLLNAVSPLL